MKFSRGCIGGVSMLLLVTSLPARAASCTVSATAPGAIAYTPWVTAPATGTGDIKVTCTYVPPSSSVVSYTIAVSAGGSGNVASRQLRDGSNLLRYNLYSDASYTTILGNGSGGSKTLSASYLLLPVVGSSETKAYPVYIQLPGAQNVPPGTYNDSLIVTVTY